MKNILLFFFIHIIFISQSFANDFISIKCVKTPEIHIDKKPEIYYYSNNLRRKPGSSNIATGELINITGRITDLNCLPIQNAIIYIWHANSYGISYHEHKKNLDNDKFDPNFSWIGKFIVNNLGYYNFITIMPGKNSNIDPHINFLVQHPNFPDFTTKMFFSDHNYNNHINSLSSRKILDNSKIFTELLVAPFTYNNKATKTYIFNITLNGYNKFSKINK